jgi:hypothetical protein
VEEIGDTAPEVSVGEAEDDAVTESADCGIAAGSDSDVAFARESEAASGEEGDAATGLNGARAGAETRALWSAKKTPKVTKKSIGRNKRNDLFTGKNE